MNGRQGSTRSAQKRTVAVAVTLVMAAAACSGSTKQASPKPTTTPAVAPTPAQPTPSGPCADKTWMRRSDSPEQRAKALVAAMTLDQKISQVHGQASKQDFRLVPGIPALCIPDLTVTNGPAGVGPSFKPLGGDPATALPAPIALAATWDPAMATAFGNVAGGEMRDVGRNLLEAPDVDLARVPTNGRTFEAFGEDPLLASRMAVAEIKAVQSHGIIAMAKHYLVNNQENDRGNVNAVVDERTLRELYLPAFEAAVRDAKVAAVMCSYNKVNGTHSCQNPAILTDILRKDWGFTGFVQSDFVATHSTVPSVKAGLDLEMPTGEYLGAPLRAAVRRGQVPMSALNRMVSLRFTEMFRQGIFDRPVTKTPIPVDAHGKTAQAIAAAGSVLLRNEGALLPLDASRLKSIAVVGPYSTSATTGGGGSSKVDPLRTISPLVGIRSAAGKDVQVLTPSDATASAAAAVAGRADVAVVVVGDAESEGKDRPSLSLPPGQDSFISAVAAANPNTVVVVHAGAPVLMPWLSKVRAVLMGWYPGQEDGTVTAALLFGAAEPTGRLPITFPSADGNTPTNTPDRYPGVNGTVTYQERLDVGYRYVAAGGPKPLFPFGFGLG